MGVNQYVYGQVTGFIDEGETDEQAAARELKEETGVKHIKPVTDDIFSLEIACVHGHVRREKYVASHVHLNLTYLLEVDENDTLTIQEDENSGVKWVKLEDIAKESSEPWMIEKVFNKLKEILKRTYNNEIEDNADNIINEYYNNNPKMKIKKLFLKRIDLVKLIKKNIFF